jgi:hypothetical protein
VNLLEGPRAKLARAREHVELLKEEFEAWTGKLELATVLDKDRSQVIITVTSVPEFPLRWSTIMGDAVHNYRCVLDHLVWQLARANLPAEQTPPNTVQFPIVSAEDDWAGQRFRVGSLSERHQRLVESCQPYHRGLWMGAGPPRQPLEDLRDLSNADKHRFVVVTTYGADIAATMQLERVRGISLGQVRYLVGLPVGVGTEIAMIDILDLPDESDYEVALRYEPATYFAIGGGANVVRVLEEIEGAVEGILRLFSTEAALLHTTHPSLQTPGERELTALRSIRARLRIITQRLETMDVSPGVVMPDPYSALGAYIDDLSGLWESEFSSSVNDEAVRELVERLFGSQAALEEDGIVRHDVNGLPALERLSKFAELLEGLKKHTETLAAAIDQRLGMSDLAVE